MGTLDMPWTTHPVHDIVNINSTTPLQSKHTQGVYKDFFFSILSNASSNIWWHGLILIFHSFSVSWSHHGGAKPGTLMWEYTLDGTPILCKATPTHSPRCNLAMFLWGWMNEWMVLLKWILAPESIWTKTELLMGLKINVFHWILSPNSNHIENCSLNSRGISTCGNLKLYRSSMFCGPSSSEALQVLVQILSVWGFTKILIVRANIL